LGATFTCAFSIVSIFWDRQECNNFVEYIEKTEDFMSINNNPYSIYFFNINSPEDIRRVIDSSEQAKQKVSKVLDAKYRIIDIDVAITNLYISNLYKNVYYRSFGFSTCSKFVNEMDSYHALLKHSFTVCNDIITPLLIRSFKLHQEALPCYAIDQQHKSAIASMSETGEIAKTIAREYKKLGKEFRLSGGRAGKLQVDLNKDQYLIYTKLEELQAEQNLAAISLREPILNARISSLNVGINSLGKLVTALKNMSTFWYSVTQHSKDLTSPELADSRRVATLMRIKESRENQDKLFFAALEKEAKPLEEDEKAVDVVVSNSLNEKKSLDEVVKSMKTGRDTILSPIPKKESLVELLKSMTFNAIEEAFENSYFNWLALAKINQAMVVAIRGPTREAEGDQNDILEMEKDPLAVMLHATSF
jgi:hypothetical protein